MSPRQVSKRQLRLSMFDSRLMLEGLIVDVRCMLLLDFDIRSIGVPWATAKNVDTSIEKRERMVWYRLNESRTSKV